MKEKESVKKGGGKSIWLFLLVFFLFSMLSIVLAILCLGGAKSSFFQRYFIPLSITICTVFSFFCGVAIWFTLTKKETLTKGALSFYILVLFALGICLLLQRTGFFEVVKTPEKLQEYLERAGVWMPIFYILLQFLQVVILPIPSIVSTVAGVALFGAFWTTVYSLSGILIGSIVAFLIGRKLGNKAVAWMVGEETLQKWQKKLKGKDNLFLTLMFVLPLFPDDILCFLAGLSSMTTKYFLSVILISRIIAITATCYSFDFIPFNTWWGISLWLLFIAGIIVAFVLIYKNMDKIQRLFKKKKGEKRLMKK